jgi:hypothetical protein
MSTGEYKGFVNFLYVNGSTIALLNFAHDYYLIGPLVEGYGLGDNSS